MNKTMTFFRRFFLAIGIVWFLCALAIVLFKLNFQTKEILITLLLPLAYALVRLFDKDETQKISK